MVKGKGEVKMITPAVQTHKICSYSNHDWRQVTPARSVTIDNKRVQVVNFVCMDCFKIALRECVR